MNAFANTLFSVLFGWIKTGVQGMWNTLTSGRLSGFFVWLGRSWIPVVAVLCVAGTVLDYVIWFIRWRPYLLWRTRWQRFRAWLRREDPRQFERGYDSVIGLEGKPRKQSHAQRRNREQALMQEEEFYAQVRAAQAAQQEKFLQNPPDRFPHFPQNEDFPQGADYPQNETPYDGPLPGFPPENVSPAPRHRRSEKHAPRFRLPQLLTGENESEEMVNGLPPLMDQEEAFHRPVYPQQRTDPRNENVSAQNRYFR